MNRVRAYQSYEEASKRSQYGPVQVIHPTAECWANGKFVFEHSEIDGYFSTRAQWILVMSPKTGKGIMFHQQARVMDASNEDVIAYVWKAAGPVVAELHILAD